MAPGDGMAKSLDPRYNGGIAPAGGGSSKKKSGGRRRGSGRGGGGGGGGRGGGGGGGGGGGNRRNSGKGRGGGGKGDRRSSGKGGKGKGCFHCGGNHTRANCPELEPPIPEKVVLNFKDEAAYKAYLAKCQKERDASEDIAFRNHGEYIKYLTKIKEKEDDAHAAWAVTKAELDKKAQAEAELRAIDAALAKTRVSAPPKAPAAPPVAPVAPKPPPAPLPPPMSGAQKLAASPFSSAWGDSSDDD